MKARLGRLERCADCGFSWSMRVGGGAPTFYCGELNAEVKGMSIPDNCPLPDYEDMLKKYMPVMWARIQEQNKEAEESND